MTTSTMHGDEETREAFGRRISVMSKISGTFVVEQYDGEDFVAIQGFVMGFREYQMVALKSLMFTAIMSDDNMKQVSKQIAEMTCSNDVTEDNALELVTRQIRTMYGLSPESYISEEIKRSILKDFRQIDVKLEEQMT